MTEQFIEVYRRHKNLKLAANELGVRWQTLYVWLRKAGEPVTGDKSRYGSESDQFAAKSERMFMQLIPEAENLNVKKFQSKVDFLVGRYRVDLKASRLIDHSRTGNSPSWNFSIKKQELHAEFFVCLGFDAEGETVIKCFLIPIEIGRTYTTIRASPRVNKWSQYEVATAELRPFFAAMNEERAA